jgi:uroporphyrinogen decarboxylase
MNSKERVLATINHEEPDKVPIDAWMPPEVSNELIKFLNIDLSKDRFALQKILGHDLLYAHVGMCDCFSSCYMENRKIGENLYEDVFGIKWRLKSHKNGSYCEFAEQPLKDKKNYDKFKMPNPMEAEIF